MGREVTLVLSDWMYNAGIAGVYNVLDYHNIPVHTEGQKMTFNMEDIERYEDLFMEYMISKYKDLTILALIKDRINGIQHQLEMEEPNVENINNGITYIKGKFSNKAYADVITKTEGSSLKKIKDSGFDELKENIEVIGKRFRACEADILRSEVIGYYDQNVKVSKSPFAVVDKYINTKLFKLDDSFENAKEYDAHAKNKNDYQCFQCGNPIKSIGKGLNYLNHLYYDTARKTSHVWDFKSDVEMCPICHLVYMSIPAGITTIHGRGLFVNANDSIEQLYKVNNSIYYNIKMDTSSKNRLSYSHIIKSYLDEMVKQKSLMLNDVQVVEMRDNKYHFVLVSKQVFEKVDNARKEFSKIRNRFYADQNGYVSIYDEVLKNLFDNSRLFRLVDKLVHLKCDANDKNAFTTEDIISLIKIENTKGGRNVKKVRFEEIDKAVQEGKYLRSAYMAKNSAHKITSIAYKLQGALRAGNSHRFMDTVLTCYSYVNKPVPNVMIDCLKDENSFRTLGYAYTAALIGGGKTMEVSAISE